MRGMRSLENFNECSHFARSTVEDPPIARTYFFVPSLCGDGKFAPFVPLLRGRVTTHISALLR